MPDHLVTKYIKLTEVIMVPEEWPVCGLERFLVSLIDQVINAVNLGKSVVLQVINIPTKLVKRQDRSGTKYFFEKVFTEDIIESYVIDVILIENAIKIQAMKNYRRPEVTNLKVHQHRVLLDNYNVHVYQSECTTVYYLMPTMQTIQSSSVIKNLQCDQCQRKILSERQTNYEVMFLFAAVSIIPLLFIILLVETNFHL